MFSSPEIPKGEITQPELEFRKRESTLLLNLIAHLNMLLLNFLGSFSIMSELIVGTLITKEAQ